MNKEGGTWNGHTPLRSPRHPLLGRCGLTAAPRSVLTEQTEKKKFAAKSSVKSGPDGNPKTGKTVLAVTSRLGPRTVKEGCRRWRVS
jgi:hypothetical protein